MASEQKAASTHKIKVDELTARVVPDPKNAGDVVLVTGFLGDSSKPGHTRIYWDASMSSYIDAEEADILHTEPLPKEQSPLGGSYIWLKRTARGLSGGPAGNAMTGKFFEGPLMAAYGSQFGGGAAPAGVAGPVPVGTVAYSYYIACHPSVLCTQLACHSVQYICVSGFCTRTAIECTGLCPVNTTYCLSPGCPPIGPGTPVQGTPVQGTPVQGQAAAMAQPAAAAQMQMMPSLICSYSPGCWYSFGACPTMYGCGPHHTPGCPQVQLPAAAAAPEAAAGAAFGTMPSLVCSYAPGCWYSFGACPTMFGCGPHLTARCPQVQDPAAAAGQQQWTGYYCPGTAMCSVASCGYPCTR